MKTLLLVFLPLFCVGQSMDDLQWLLGKWQRSNTTIDKSTTESWKFENDSYIGHSFTLTNGKTTFEENMKLKFIDGVLTYSVNAPENNDWINFTLSQPYSKEHLKFDNKKHDFPKYIHYTLNADHSISAIVGDEENKIDFHFIQAQENDSIQINAVISKMQLAYFSGRLSDIASFYSKDALITGGNTLIEGHDNIVNYWQSFQKGQWILNTNWLKTYGDRAVQRGSSKINYPNGTSDNVDFLLNWKKVNGEWLISQDIYW